LLPEPFPVEFGWSRASFLSTSSKRRRTVINSWNSAVANSAGATNSPFSNLRTTSGQGSFPNGFGVAIESGFVFGALPFTPAVPGPDLRGNSIRMVGPVCFGDVADVVLDASLGGEGMEIRLWHDGQLIPRPIH